MPNVSQRYVVLSAKRTVSHAFNVPRWGKRPLQEAAIEHASTDVLIIKQLQTEMKKTELFEVLCNAVSLHSARYEFLYRERENSMCRNALGKFTNNDKDTAMEEHPIISPKDLPPDPPVLPQLARAFSQKSGTR